MDLLWAMSHAPAPPPSDGSWDTVEDFVGDLQFWGFALVSGSSDSIVRMWDSRYNRYSSTLG